MDNYLDKMRSHLVTTLAQNTVPDLQKDFYQNQSILQVLFYIRICS